jgi:hypothetical protein
MLGKINYVAVDGKTEPRITKYVASRTALYNKEQNVCCFKKTIMKPEDPNSSEAPAHTHRQNHAVVCVAAYRVPHHGSLRPRQIHVRLLFQTISVTS